MLFKGRGVGDSRGHQGQALTALRGHHDTTLGVSRTHRRHSSMHTWAPRHMWRAPLWPQRHEAWYGLPPLRVGIRMPKDLCSEPVGEDMGVMPWFNWALDMQLTQAYDDYAWHRSTMPCAPGKNSHGCNAMVRCCGALT